MVKEKIDKIEVQPFDLSNQEARFLVSFNDKHFEVSKAVAELISILKNTKSIDDAVLMLSIQHNKIYTQEDIYLIINHYIDPIIKEDSPKSAKIFLYKKDLIPSEKINILSMKLKALFFPPVTIILLGFIGIIEILFFIMADFSYHTLGHISLFEIIIILIFYLFSSLFHELGHASACRYFNSKHGNIGVGLYLNFPVFYTNVSEIWKLQRKQRLIVNLAGIYFQMIYLIPFIIFFFIFPENIIIQHFILVINLNFLFVLNPFFKFDGYWIMSDLLGVPNLRKRGLEFLAYVYKKIRKYPIREKPFLLTMKSKEKNIMIIYSIIVNIFMGRMFQQNNHENTAELQKIEKIESSNLGNNEIAQNLMANLQNEIVHLKGEIEFLRGIISKE